MASENILMTIIGPTAIGKTSLSIALATHFATEIVSCDSRQFYKEMSIGTAVPSMEELSLVPHHFIQNRSIHEDYNVGQFEKDALFTLEKLFQQHRVLVMVGGSGLYVDAVLKGLDYFPEIPASIREELSKKLENEGLEALQQLLLTLDPKSYQKIAIDNPHRLIRALEICIGTNKPYSSFKNKGLKERPFRSIMLGLTGERSVVYDRINLRVDKMIKDGLVSEAQLLYQHKQLNALQTVGYKELFQYFDGTLELDVAISEIKKNTRRFAKRQFTWFKKYEEAHWFDFTTPHKDIISTVEHQL